MGQYALSADDLMIFARVADDGGFSHAAARLGLPKSTVSRRVAALEEALGERLFLRTTRSLTLTDLGRSVLEHARHVAEDVEAARSVAANRQAEPSGRLRASMPHDLPNLLLAPSLAAFVSRHPRIALDLDLTARHVDLVGENVDIALRVGDLADDATLSARRLASFTGRLYAAPAYVARRGLPQQPSALAEHDALRLLSRNGEPARWTLVRGEARWDGVPPGRATVNSPEVLMRMAIGGAGIAMIHDPFATRHVERGELVPVLSEWRSPPVPVWAVFPGRRLMPARTRAFLDALVEAFSGPECQAIEAASSREDVA